MVFDAPPEAPIAIERVDEHRVVLVATVADTAAAAALQSRLEAQARAACAGDFTLGHYAFDVQKKVTGAPAPASPMRVRQEVTCGAARPGPPPGATPPAFDAPSGDDAAVIAATERWFALRTALDFGTRATLLTATMQAMRGDWAASWAAEAARAGTGFVTHVVKVTWYDHPPGAEPGVYAAADFENRSDLLAAECGYIVWFKPDGGAGFLLQRQEIGALSRADVAKMDVTTQAAIRRELRCPG